MPTSRRFKVCWLKMALQSTSSAGGVLPPRSVVSIARSLKVRKSLAILFEPTHAANIPIITYAIIITKYTIYYIQSVYITNWVHTGARGVAKRQLRTFKEKGEKPEVIPQPMLEGGIQAAWMRLSCWSSCCSWLTLSSSPEAHPGSMSCPVAVLVLLLELVVVLETCEIDTSSVQRFKNALSRRHRMDPASSRRRSSRSPWRNTVFGPPCEARLRCPAFGA